MAKIEHTSFAGLQYEPNKKLGYYLVDNEIYYNKFHALLVASKKKLPVKWFFNEDVFMKFPWHVEPEESLEELYRQRAQQLRDTYDHIRVECSGGSDSVQIVYSFLLNNIHIDEVIFRYPKGGDKDVAGNARDLRSENILSEYEFAARPLLDWIKINYPRTKVTVFDYTDLLLEEAETKDESWVFRSRHYLQAEHHTKYKTIVTDLHNNLVEKGQSICVLYGIDKPKITIKDGKFFLYFNDGQASHSDPVIGEYGNVTNEFFFWSPESCKLLAKQAHMIKRWFEMPVHYNMSNLLKWPSSANTRGRTIYEQVIKGIIYPKYDPNTFQTFKSTNNIYNEMSFWFHHNFKETKAHQVWQSGIDFIVDNLDEKYIGRLHGTPANIELFESTFYCIGDSQIPESDLPLMPAKNYPYHQTDGKWAIVPPDSVRRHMINGSLVIY